MRNCIVRDLGRMSYTDALAIQQDLASALKQGRETDHLFFVEHPHVVTVGRNGHEENLLASEQVLSRSGIALHHSDRGGDVTYHGPGQIVGYPVIDLREWKRDVGAYVRAIEQVVIDTLIEFGIESERIPGMTGVWTGQAKIAAIGVHLSRWVTTHGFALNVNTDLSYFRYIVPCGLSKPVTSMQQLGVDTDPEAVKQALVLHFRQIFDFRMQAEMPALMES